MLRTNYTPELEEMILCRGDSRYELDPYWLAVERVADTTDLDIAFHVESAVSHTGGVILETQYAPLHINEWTHVAAVFEYHVRWTNTDGTITPWPTNELRLYVNGVRLQPGLPPDNDVFLEDPSWQNIVYNSTYTSEEPFQDLDPAFSPRVTLGARNRPEEVPSVLAAPDAPYNAQPFRGDVDELTVYGRALTDPEIAAIAAAGSAGKADTSVLAGQSLAKLKVLIDGVERDLAWGDNARWNTRTIEFTALNTNSLLTLESLLPGTLVDRISLVEYPSEISYLPEQSLQSLFGEDPYGLWQLEILDNRAGPDDSQGTNTLPILVSWQLDFKLQPEVLPPVIDLYHGIVYSNTLAAGGVQYFVVDVPQWATMATNILLSAVQYQTTNVMNLGVLYESNNFPVLPTNGIFWPPVTAGITNLTTNTTPWLNIGQPYYLAVTNTNFVAVSFELGVWFDITSLTNCEPLSNYVWQAGIPRYFQFDVPTNTLSPSPDTNIQQVAFYLTGLETNAVGFRSNVTIVLSEHLPLPDLTHYDYIFSLAAHQQRRADGGQQHDALGHPDQPLVRRRLQFRRLQRLVLCPGLLPHQLSRHHPPHQ